MDERRYVYIISNEQPGWVKGKVYRGEIIGDDIVFEDRSRINYYNEKKNIENGYVINGYSNRLTQDMLRNMYIGQNIPEAEAAKILLGMKHGGKTRKRKRKRNSKKR
jgi:hypothetical protein